MWSGLARWRARCPIRVAFLSRHRIEVIDDARVSPAGLAPVQVSDPGPDGAISSATRAGRGALAVRIHPPGGRALQAVCCHLKSRLLSFPGPAGTSRFSPHHEGGRARVGDRARRRPRSCGTCASEIQYASSWTICG